MHFSKIRYYVALLLAVLLYSCTKQKVVEIPIEETKLIPLLVDFHMAKAAANVYPAEKQDSMYAIYKGQVLEIHHLTESEYEHIDQILESDLSRYHKIEKKVNIAIKRRNDNKSLAKEKTTTASKTTSAKK